MAFRQRIKNFQHRTECYAQMIDGTDTSIPEPLSAPLETVLPIPKRNENKYTTNYLLFLKNLCAVGSLGVGAYSSGIGIQNLARTVQVGFNMSDLESYYYHVPPSSYPEFLVTAAVSVAGLKFASESRRTNQQAQQELFTRQGTLLPPPAPQSSIA